MGVTHIKTKVRKLSGQGRSYTAQFLVDTGAVDCLAPADALTRIGIRREGSRVYELANGQSVELEYGYARLEFFGDETVAPIIFGPKGCEPSLGTVALASTGLVVDPKTQSLRRMHAIPLKSTVFGVFA